MCSHEYAAEAEASVVCQQTETTADGLYLLSVV